MFRRIEKQVRRAGQHQIKIKRLQTSFLDSSYGFSSNSRQKKSPNQSGIFLAINHNTS